MNAITSSFVCPTNSNAPEVVSKRDIYQEANETHNVDLVRQLNDEGMKPIVPSFSGPAIISSFMDISTKHDIILGFMKKLRETNKLLTEKEFQLLPSKNWIEKESMGRILGCDHLMRNIMENQLRHIKVPLKIAVVEEGRESSVDINKKNIHANFIKKGSFKVGDL